MNHWASFLAALPATQQRAIARAQRISLPRGADAATRHARLRRALCHADTVRATYAMLSPAERAAVADLRARRRGIGAAELAARYGPLRPLRELAADPRPQSVAERLVLLGWLFERPDALGRPSRWLLPPELRRWLPAPLALADLGPAPAAPCPPILRAAAALLHAAAARPLPLRAAGSLRSATARMLANRLTPLDPAAAAGLLEFTLPLLEALGLLDRHQGSAAPAPAARRFLASPAADQLARLAEAWYALPTPDPWLRRLLRTQRGISWPTLRRRLAAWAADLPADRLLDPATLAPALAASLGPLADAQTHGYRTVLRAPWSAPRAAAIWQAALRGPLAWLGLVAWAPGEQSPAPPATSSPMVAVGSRQLSDRPPTARRPDASDGLPARVFRPGAPAAAAPGAWRYSAVGRLTVPHGSGAAALLDLLPFAEWQAADAEADHYAIDPRTLARAGGAGHSSAALRELLARQAGPPPAEWAALLEARRPALRIVHGDLLIAEQPAQLNRAARASSGVRHALLARPAPGIALVAPGRAGRLARALAHQGLPLDQAPPDPPPPPARDLSPAQCATLLEACAALRQGAANTTPPLALDQIEAYLRARLTPALRLAAAGPPPPADLPPLEPGQAAPPPLADLLAQLRAAIRARRTITIAYDTAGQGQPIWRTVRPTLIERHGDTWLLRAYCHARQADRTFRLDRIAALG